MMLPVLLPLLTAGLVSCTEKTGGLLGYSHQELFPEDVRTVAVDIFENRTFYQGVEFDLTEALIKEIELRTPYKVVANQRADTLLAGTVISVRQNVLSRVQDGGVPQEMQVIVEVAFEWKNLRSGEVMRARDSIEGTGQYIPTHPVGEPYPTAQHEAVGELAREIVSVMRRDW